MQGFDAEVAVADHGPVVVLSELWAIGSAVAGAAVFYLVRPVSASKLRQVLTLFVARKEPLARYVRLLDAAAADDGSAASLARLAREARRLAAGSSDEKGVRGAGMVAKLDALSEGAALDQWSKRSQMIAAASVALGLAGIIVAQGTLWATALEAMGVLCSMGALVRCQRGARELRAMEAELIVMLAAASEVEPALPATTGTGPFRLAGSRDGVAPLAFAKTAPLDTAAVLHPRPVRKVPPVRACLACGERELVRTRFVALRGILPSPSASTDFPRALCEGIVCRACGRMEWFVEDPELLLRADCALVDATLPQDGGLVTAPEAE